MEKMDAKRKELLQAIDLYKVSLHTKFKERCEDMELMNSFHQIRDDIARLLTDLMETHAEVHPDKALIPRFHEIGLKGPAATFQRPMPPTVTSWLQSMIVSTTNPNHILLYCEHFAEYIRHVAAGAIQVVADGFVAKVNQIMDDNVGLDGNLRAKCDELMHRIENELVDGIGNVRMPLCDFSANDDIHNVPALMKFMEGKYEMFEHEANKVADSFLRKLHAVSKASVFTSARH